jgi:chaperonin GroEL
MTINNQFERVVFQPQTYEGFQAGINQIANAVRPTLGPTPRMVAITKTKPHDQTPEIFDNGGTIARRIIQLPDRDVDTGAMFLRQLLWRQHEQMGDGTATTAVIFQAVYNEAVKFIAAGGNAMMMRRYLEQGLRIILDELVAQTIPVDGQETIAQVAESVCVDAELSQVLGEIFDIVGPYGQIEIRSGRTRNIEREYVSGTFFESGLHTQVMVTDHENVRAQVENAAIFLSDLDIKAGMELVPVVRAAIDAGYAGLVVMCKSISDDAIGVLMKVSQNPQRFRAMAVKTPGNKLTAQAAYLEDLSTLTGGKPYIQIAADSAQNIQTEHLGQARRIWADKTFLSVIGGQGHPLEIRKQVAGLKGRYDSVDDTDIRKLTLTRLGKFMGGAASLFVGGLSEIDIEARKETAEMAIGAVRAALLKGVLPGGGAALLACKPTLDALAQQTENLEESVCYQILSRALEEPMRTILSNSGYDPSVYLARIEVSDIGNGVDARSGEIVDMVAAGVFDSAGVLLEAVRGAVTSAALGITVDTMVHKKRQKIANRP